MEFFYKTKNFPFVFRKSQKNSRHFPKNSRIWKKLNVMEAKCLRLPPKNRAKNSPGLFTIAAICLQWRVPFIYNRPYNNVKIFHAIWFNAMKKYFDLRRGKKSKYKGKSAYNRSYLWIPLFSFQSNEAQLRAGLFADTGHYLKVTK